MYPIKELIKKISPLLININATDSSPIEIRATCLYKNIIWHML